MRFEVGEKLDAAVRAAARKALVVTPRSTKTLASFAVFGFLFLHIIMLAIFSRFGVTPMVTFNALSIIVYGVLITLLWKEYWRTFALLINLQIYVHMALAVYCVGWDAGFQLTLIAITVLDFYAEYAARSMRVRTLHAFNLALVSMVLYLVLLSVFYGRPSPYSLPEDVSFGLRILWSVVVFVVVIAYLQLFLAIVHNAEDTLSDKATHDELTGLPNRAFMMDYLRDRAAGEGLSGRWVAMADIDDFKQFNDTYGHNCGDYVLKSIGTLMRDARDDYVLCRWGGEEFLLSGQTDGTSSPQAVLEDLRSMVEAHGFWYGENRLRVTVTIGVACYEEGQSIGAWVNAADKRLYVGKNSGKNRVVA